jgi:hypothetical protein
LRVRAKIDMTWSVHVLDKWQCPTQQMQLGEIILTSPITSWIIPCLRLCVRARINQLLILLPLRGWKKDRVGYLDRFHFPRPLPTSHLPLHGSAAMWDWLRAWSGNSEWSLTRNHGTARHGLKNVGKLYRQIPMGRYALKGGGGAGLFCAICNY